MVEPDIRAMLRRHLQLADAQEITARAERDAHEENARAAALLETSRTAIVDMFRTPNDRIDIAKLARLMLGEDARPTIPEEIVMLATAAADSLAHPSFSDSHGATQRLVDAILKATPEIPPKPYRCQCGRRYAGHMEAAACWDSHREPQP